MEFRNIIKELCHQNNMTQKDLADKLGISDISLNKTLRGEYPQLQTLERIAEALNVPISRLFTDDKESSDLTCPNCGTKLKLIEDK